MQNPKNKYFTRYRIARKGVWRWVIATAYCIRDEKGDTVKMAGINLLEPIISESGEIKEESIND